MSEIVIVDYGSGNLQSVVNAFKICGAKARVTDSSAAVGRACKLILPGVGAFKDAVSQLRKKKLIKPIKDFIKSGRPYLGMCLGLQILFESSEEGNAAGLSVFKGKVRKFRREKGLKIPHMGWNSVNFGGEAPRIFDGIPEGTYFYFVHSYYAAPAGSGLVSGVTKYGNTEFASVISKDNVTATQFHPEKSQGAGLSVVRNFIRG